MRDEWQRNLDLSKAAYEAVEELLPDNVASTIREFIYDVNEWGLGVETIIDALLEYDIHVSRDQKSAIDVAADSMGLERGQANLLVTDG